MGTEQGINSNMKVDYGSVSKELANGTKIIKKNSSDSVQEKKNAQLKIVGYRFSYGKANLLRTSWEMYNATGKPIEHIRM